MQPRRRENFAGRKMAMTTASEPQTPAVAIPPDWTLAELCRQLGDVPLERIRAYPPLGTATDDDVLQSKSRYGAICELIDGVLVEKTMGYYESLVAVAIIEILGGFVRRHGLGIVLAPDGPLRVLPGQVRIPDVSFISWDKFPGRKLPAEPIPALAPDLAVEVLSPGNTPGEMRRKLRDYFAAGVRLVWYIDPQSRTAQSYTSPEQVAEIPADGVLAGGDVLPGFELRLADVLVKDAAEEGK
jgi:Uma2 family endonuclease